jgi:nicotinamide-nucleotide amidase
MPRANLRQALIPSGAEVLANEVGTAPGFAARCGGSLLAALPGPPHEMRHVFARELAPRLSRLFPPRGGLATARFHLCGMSESGFAERAGAWMERGACPRMGVTATDGALSVSILARGATRAEAERALAERCAAFRERFGAHVYSESEPRLEQVVGRELIRRGVSIATAESCTGGLLAAALTRVSGISAVFRAGWVTYADEAKVAALGVDPASIERAGAVSSEVAEAMARGAAERAGAELAVAVTGIAGPGGGTAEKPVGLVWFGLCAGGRARSAERRYPPADRERVRRFAVTTALALILEDLRALDAATPGARRSAPSR